MLYSLLLIFGAYIVISPFFMFFSFRYGFEIGVKMEKTAKLPKIFPKKKKDRVLSEKQQRFIDELSNIERYDGTPFGQKEIK